MIRKIDNFRGDLSDVSAETATLTATNACYSCAELEQTTEIADSKLFGQWMSLLEQAAQPKDVSRPHLAHIDRYLCPLLIRCKISKIAYAAKIFTAAEQHGFGVRYSH